MDYSPFSATCSNKQTIEGWYGGADQYEVTIIRPNGTSVTGAPDAITSGDGPGGNIYIDNASEGRDPANNDKQLYAEISDCGSSGARPASGTWTIQVTARNVTSGKPFHLWLDQDGGLGGTYALGANGFDNRYVIGTPGTAASVITVAAYTTKVNWPTATGTHRYTNPPAVGDLAPFSSGGPTRDGRAKPDISAPGMGTMSSLSSGVASSSVSPLILATDGKHWLLQGTSMATPVVTGATALLLQAPASAPRSTSSSGCRASPASRGATSIAWRARGW